MPTATFIASTAIRLFPPRLRTSPLHPRKFIIKAASPDSPSLPPPPSSLPTPPIPKPQIPASSLSLSRILTSLWPFSRPHTVYGTIIAVTSLALCSLQTVPLSQILTPYLIALIPALLINIYIVGLNQYYDIEIDKVNKPTLPLPASRLTKQDARFIILFSLITGLSFCLIPTATPALRFVLLGSTILGTAYSMPPFRLKRFALLASVAILVVRGLLTNLCFYMHLTSAMTITPTIAFAAKFFTVFGIVIALLKDAPDIRGDRMFGIRTFSVRLGANSVFWACVTVLAAIFTVAAGFYWSARGSLVGGVVMVLTHLGVAGGLLWRGREVDTERSGEIYRFYMLCWKAFYLEYLLLPVAGL